jgi:hypothetical protein
MVPGLANIQKATENGPLIVDLPIKDGDFPRFTRGFGKFLWFGEHQTIQNLREKLWKMTDQKFWTWIMLILESSYIAAWHPNRGDWPAPNNK